MTDIMICVLLCPCHYNHLSVCYLSEGQVQEKKVKKISEMNLDPSKAVGNGSIASSSNSSSPKRCLANGGSPDRSYNYLGNDFSFPPGGLPSLHLPVVVVLYTIILLTLLGTILNTF